LIGEDGLPQVIATVENDERGLHQVVVFAPGMPEGFQRWRLRLDPLSAPDNPWHVWPHRPLEDGRLLALQPLLFDGWRLHVVRDGIAETSSDVYDFQESSWALDALQGWSGEGEPEGWYRHKPSNRRRPDGDPTKEYVQP
jgi:hypothetical protein